MEKQEAAHKIAEAVEGLKYHEWRKIAAAIEKEYSSALSRTELRSAKELEKAILFEFNR